MSPAVRPSTHLPIVALATAAVLAALLPDGRCSDALALLALVAALAAAQEGRTRDMAVAAGLAAGLAPAGWLLAPLFVGLAIRDRAARHLPVAVLAGALAALALPWSAALAPLPNLAALVLVWPDGLGLVAAIGVGAAAWLGARATILPRAALLAEARLGALLLALVLPLPLAAIGFVLMIAVLPVPTSPRLHAANDNVVERRTIRLAA